MIIHYNLHDDTYVGSSIFHILAIDQYLPALSESQQVGGTLSFLLGSSH